MSAPFGLTWDEHLALVDVLGETDESGDWLLTDEEGEVLAGILRRDNQRHLHLYGTKIA